MKIEFQLVSNSKEEISIMDDFCNMLVDNIKKDILNSIDIHRLNMYENVLINSDWIKWTKKPKKINMLRLMKYIVHNIKYKSRRHHKYLIYIDENNIFPNSEVSVNRLARFLDKGNDLYKGTFYITRVFTKYKRNILKYWESYVSLRLKKLSTKEVIIK